jgi:hypothetical protein
MNMRSGLAAGGVFAAIAVAASGCGSSASTTSSGGTGGSAVRTPGGSAVAARPTGSTATTIANPSWAAGLGPGVTVIAPKSVAAGHGSPQAVVTGATAAADSGNYASLCAYYEPSLQPDCIHPESSASPSAVASQIGTIKNLTIGYTAIRGDQALVGGTGTFCASGKCGTNRDPAALFSSGKTFSALWNSANNQAPGGYSLGACIKVDGKWYLYQPASSS